MSRELLLFDHQYHHLSRIMLWKERSFIRSIGLIIMLVMAVHLLVLTQYPSIFIDEPWIASAAWNWTQTGVNFEPMHQGALDQFGYVWMLRPYLGHLPWWLSFKALGLGLFQARLVSWVFGVLVLAALIWIGRRSYGEFTGVLAALLLSLTAPFIDASHYVRQEIIVVFVLLFAYGLTLWTFERERRWAHFLVGLAVGLSADIHHFGIFFIPSLISLYFIHYGRVMLRRSGTWFCALGGLLAYSLFFVLHILPNPETYFKFYSFDLNGRHNFLLTDFSLESLLGTMIGEFSRFRFFDNELQFALIGASMVFLVARRKQSDRYLLMFTGVALMVFMLFVGSKSNLYAILLYPFFMLMVAEVFVHLLRESRALNPQRFFLSALLVLAIFVKSIQYARPLYETQHYNYAQVTEQMRSVIPAGSKVLAMPQWWFGLADYDFRSVLNVGFYRFYNDYHFAEAMDKIRPDYFIVGPEILWLVSEDVVAVPKEGYALPKKEFEQFLAQRATLYAQFTDRYFGAFKIYAIRWP